MSAKALPIIAALGSLFSQNAFGISTEHAFTAVPSRFQTRELTVGARGLGEICVSRSAMPDGSVCNPAFLGEVENSSLMGRVFFGNGYSALSTANNMIYESISKDFLTDLFQNQNVTSLEAHTGALFVTQNFSASFSPYRVQYTSELHNPNFAVVAIHAAVEKSFILSGGAPLIEALPWGGVISGGMKARFLTRDYVHGSFNQYEIMVEEPRSLLPSKSQKAIYFDPYLGWTAPQSAWKPRIGFGVTNLGWLTPKDPLYPEPTDVSIGFGLEPTVGFGKLRLGVDFADLVHGNSQGRLRTGVSYQFGILEGLLGYNASASTVGVIFGFQIFQAGVVYEFNRSDIAGGAENRIATEISIKL